LPIADWQIANYFTRNLENVGPDDSLDPTYFNITKFVRLKPIGDRQSAIGNWQWYNHSLSIPLKRGGDLMRLTEMVSCSG
jgi:hypothetical protein